MKKQIPIFLGILFLLTSCNFPLFRNTQAPDANDIATRVAATLTASTPFSSATLTPTVHTLPTIEMNTTTPTATATASVTPTSTTPPGDPKLSYGNPDYKWNESSTGDPFGLIGDPYEDEAVIITHNKALTFTSKAINNGNRWRLSSSHGMDFYLEGTFTVASCSGKDNYGLVMQTPGYNDKPRYYFGVSCDGQYTFQQWKDTGYDFDSLISWTSDPNIKTGAGQTNRLGILSQNDSFKFYINGILVKEYSGAAITAEGHYGANINAKESSNFTVSLVELLEWELP